MDKYYNLSIKEVIDLLFANPKEFEAIKNRLYYFEQCNEVSTAHSDARQVFFWAYDIYQSLNPIGGAGMARSIPTSNNPTYQALVNEIVSRLNN